MTDSCWVIFPPFPNIPKDMEQRFERAILQGFSMDLLAPFDIVSRDRLDDKTTQHTEYGFFGASGLFISRESKLNSFETWRKESSQIFFFRFTNGEDQFSESFIGSLFLLWISSRFTERFHGCKQFAAR